MIFNRHKRLNGRFKLGDESLQAVENFDYLGIRLDNKLNWSLQLEKSQGILLHRSAAINKLHRSSTSREASLAVEIYRAQAQAAALYGAEIWATCRLV